MTHRGRSRCFWLPLLGLACGDPGGPEEPAAVTGASSTGPEAPSTTGGARPSSSTSPENGEGSGTGAEPGSTTGTLAGSTSGPGASSSTGGSEEGGEVPPPMSLPIVVGVGWTGQILVSTDEGETFCQVLAMTDDHDDLFRGAGYHDGLFVAGHAGLTGNRGSLFVSSNGYAWTPLYAYDHEPDLPANPMNQWYAGAAWGNGIWLAPGGCGFVARSLDGLTWESLGRKFEGCIHIRSIAFGDGRFVIGVDDEHWYSSEDGEDWTLFEEGAGTRVSYLEQGFSGPLGEQLFHQGRGVCLSSVGSNPATILRSTRPDCSEATPVAEFPDRTTVFVFGYAPEADWAPERLPEPLRECLVGR